MTPGERRLAERLEQQLDEDYLLWYDVPIGPKQTHPDFVVLHPRRGLLILETKDWRLDTIQSATPQRWDILADGRPKTVINPLAQARHCAIQVVNALERDAQLVQASGPHQGKLAFPWGHGVVFTRITRRQFESSGLGEAIEPHLVICADEMHEGDDAELFQQRLWAMFPHAFGSRVLSLPQIDRVRWIMFPEVRVQTQGALFNDQDEQAQPVSCGREGAEPVFIRLPTLRDEAQRIADLLGSLHDGEGHAWSDMAIVCRDYTAIDTCASALRRRGLPMQLRKRAGEFNPRADAVTVMTVRVSKGLEFLVVAMPGVGHMPAPDQDAQEEARLFYVGATRATQRLIVGVSGDGAFGRRLYPGA